MIGKSVVLAVFILGVAWAQSSVDSAAVDEALKNLPPDVQISKDQVEQIGNKTAEAFKDKCAKNGGPDAFANAENAFVTLKNCTGKLVNTTVLQNEVKDAKLNGTIDEVFKKYCVKKPEFRTCISDAVEASKPCFSADEQKNLKIVYNLTEQLAEFVCFKDGDRIALFIAEGGPDCFTSRQEAIQNCTRDAFGTDVQLNANITSESIPTIKFTKKECGQLSELQLCVVRELEQCEQPTTANIVESLFKFIRKATPCKDFAETEASPRTNTILTEKNKPDSATGLAVTSLTLFMAVASLLI